MSNVSTFSQEENPTTPSIKVRLERIAGRVDKALVDIEQSMYATLQECSEELDELVADLEGGAT